MKSLRGKTIYMDFSGGNEIYGMKFVRWYRTPNMCGGPDSRKMGVGVLVYCPWLAGAPFHRRPPKGYKQGHFILCPYWAIYRSYRNACRRVRKIRRPSVDIFNYYHFKSAPKNLHGLYVEK